MIHAWEGRTGEELARELALPQVAVFDEIGSTMDVAHEMATQGAPTGTLVLADAQRTGRGRGGRQWASLPQQGIWMTLLERPVDNSTPGLLTIRVGISLASALDPFSKAPIGLKWPNDLFVGARKLAGILVEARWHQTAPLWMAIGVGINVKDPDPSTGGTGLRSGVDRFQVLSAAIPAIRSAARERGPLTSSELLAFEGRDVAVGRQCTAPIAGQVMGIAPTGELLVADAEGVRSCRAGSLVLSEE
jgi:BirA family biotin operon repressor/biotin-[acetyl-CoA-carboxylase] ligase